MNYKAIAAAILAFAMALSCGDFKAKKWGNEAKDDEIKTRAISIMSALIEITLRLKKLPAVNPYKWIPTSERLPEEAVLACMKDGGIFIGNLATVSGKMEWHDDGWEHTYELDEIIAWQPLPEPYKEDE